MTVDDHGHQHTPDEEHTVREAALDQTIEDSFPASDAPSTIPNPYDPNALPETSIPPDAGEIS